MAKRAQNLLSLPLEIYGSGQLLALLPLVTMANMANMGYPGSQWLKSDQNTVWNCHYWPEWPIWPKWPKMGQKGSKWPFWTQNWPFWSVWTHSGQEWVRIYPYGVVTWPALWAALSRVWPFGHLGQLANPAQDLARTGQIYIIIQVVSEPVWTGSEP